MWKSDKTETFDVLFILFDVLIFVVVINYFRSSDLCQFRCSDVVVVMNFKETFDVLMLWTFFDVLFGFRCSDFCSSDLLPDLTYIKTKTFIKSQLFTFSFSSVTSTRITFSNFKSSFWTDSLKFNSFDCFGMF